MLLECPYTVPDGPLLKKLPLPGSGPNPDPIPGPYCAKAGTHATRASAAAAITRPKTFTIGFPPHSHAHCCQLRLWPGGRGPLIHQTMEVALTKGRPLHQKGRITDSRSSLPAEVATLL